MGRKVWREKDQWRNTEQMNSHTRFRVEVVSLDAGGNIYTYGQSFLSQINWPFLYIYTQIYTRYVCIHSTFSCAKTYQKGRHEISWCHQLMPQGAVAAPGLGPFCRSGCVGLGGWLPLRASTSHWRPGAEQSPLPGAAVRTLLNPQTAYMSAGSLVVWP